MASHDPAYWPEHGDHAGSRCPCGHATLGIARYSTDSPPDFDKRPVECERREYLFDVEAKRIVESSVYVLVDNEWKPAERVKYEYPAQLPESVFESSPPPGVEAEDLRRR